MGKLTDCFKRMMPGSTVVTATVTTPLAEPHNDDIFNFRVSYMSDGYVRMPKEVFEQLVDYLQKHQTIEITKIKID